MQYLLHRQNSSKKRSKMPEGLPELMSDITREVLRGKPSDAETYKFIADYIDSLLTVRQRVSISADVIDDILESSVVISDMLTRTGIDFERARSAAKIIQNAFRNYLNMKEKLIPICERAEFDEFEVLNELATKCNFQKEELISVREIVRSAFKEFFKMYSNYLKSVYTCAIDVLPSVNATLNYYAKLTPSREKLDKAATKIQAYYRRYSCQKMIKATQKYKDAEFNANNMSLTNEKTTSHTQRVGLMHKKEEDMKTQLSADRRAESPEKGVHDAATKIQSLYRGYKARKDLGFRELMQARKMQDEFEKILRRKGASALNVAITAVQELFRKAQKAGRLSWTDSKMDMAAKKLQDLWHDFVARRNYVKSLYRGLLGEEGFKNLQTEHSLLNDDKVIQSVSNNIKGLFKALSLPHGEGSNQNRRGIYKVAVEHTVDGEIQREVKITCNIEDGEVVIEWLDKQENVTSIVNRAVGDAFIEIETSEEMDEEEIKKNVRDMIPIIVSTQEQSDLKSSLHGYVNINIEYDDVETGTKKKQAKIIYNIDLDFVEIENME